MKFNLDKLLKIRAVKITFEIVIILLVYVIIKTWMQKSMIEGMAPDINGINLNNQPVSLQSYQGKTVLVHFWASWCGICKLEQNSIESISKDYPVISIAMNSGTKDEVKTFMQDNRLSFMTVNDPDGQLAGQYGVRAVPASFIIGPDGRVHFKETGYTPEWGLRLRLWLTKD